MFANLEARRHVESALRLEESGTLEGYRLELNPKELGYNAMAFVSVHSLPCVTFSSDV
jgi:DNA-binding Lrp family transcriptional regulator